MMVSEIIQTYRALGLESSLNYNEFNKILITSHSTRIEGSTLTLNETRVLIEEGTLLMVSLYCLPIKPKIITRL